MKLTKITINKIYAYPIAKSSITQYIRKHFKQLFRQIMQQTSFLDKFEQHNKKISLFERLYCIVNELTDRPKCQYCKSNYVNRFIIEKNQYGKWCCPKCQASDNECIQKSKNTRKQKYGDENYSNKKQTLKTLKQKEINDPLYWEKRIAKTKATKLKNHGDENFVNVKKIKQTVEKHKAENPNYYYDREQKTKQTKIANGHDPNWNNREKYHQTCIKNFGVSSHTQTEKWKNDVKQTIQSIPDFYEKRNEKTQQTIINRYGKNYWLQTDECKNKKIISICKQKMETLMNCEYDIPIFSLDFLIQNDLNKTQYYKFKCLKCGKIFTTKLNRPNCEHYHCPKCFPICRSKNERLIYEYVKSIWNNQNEIFYHDRKVISPLEIDILVQSKDKKLGIEYNGLYWHSVEMAMNSNRYTNILDNYMKKLELCEQKNYKLLNIFEDEWLLNPTKIKNKIAFMLNLGKHISANECIIETHKNNIDLIYQNNCVAKLVFSKSRMNIHEEWEIQNYCTADGIIVDNGLNYAINEFEKQFKPKSIVTFIDRRWNNENDFANCGFFKQSFLSPQLWWFNTRLCERIISQTFEKTIAYELLNCKLSYNNNQHIQILNKNGWMRIYDCGKIKMTKYLSS